MNFLYTHSSSREMLRYKKNAAPTPFRVSTKKFKFKYIKSSKLYDLQQLIIIPLFLQKLQNNNFKKSFFFFFLS